MKSSKLSEGQTGTVLLVAVVLGVLLSGFVALAFTQQLPSIFGQYVNDAGVITEAEARSEILEENYFPLAAHYSFAQGAYIVGKYNPSDSSSGDNVDDDVIEGYDDSYDDTSERSDEVQIHQELIEDAEYESQNIFDQYVQDFTYRRCGTSVSSNADVEIGLKSTWINVSTSDEQLVNITCSTPQKEVFYQGQEDEFSQKAVNNNYQKMSGILSNALTGAENVTEKLEKYNNMQGTVTENATCTYSNTGDAEDAAESSAESAAAEIIRQIGIAIVEEEGGINRDNSDSSDDRGAEHVINEETNGNKLCVPYLGCITIEELDLIFTNLDGNVYVMDNETTLTQQSTNSYFCGCTDWSCDIGDGDAEDEFYADEDPGVTLSGDASCSMYSKNVFADMTNNPSCTQSGWYLNGNQCDTTETDTACEDSDEYLDTFQNKCYNSTSNPKHVTDSTPCDNSKFTYDSFSNSCVEDDPDPSCPDDDLEWSTASNSCVYDDRGGTYPEPTPTCTGSDRRYNADSSYDYKLDQITAMIKLVDDEMKIPTSDGFKHLQVARKYERDIASNPIE